MQRYENGTYTPDVAVLGQLASLYDTTMDELVNGGEDDGEAAA